MSRFISILFSAILLFQSAASQVPSGAPDWSQDLDVLAQELPERHPNPFGQISRHEWDAAVADVRRGLPEMDANQWMVAIQRLVARLGDAHTSVVPVADPALSVRFYPVEYYLFDDGLFVQRAAAEYSEIVGGRVVEIGRVSVEDALAAAGSLVSHENEWWVRAWAPHYLTMVEALDGLGIADDAERLTVVIDKNGVLDTVILIPLERMEPSGHNPLATREMSGWVDMRQSSEAPRWLRQLDRIYWYDYDAETKTLYVSYRAVASIPHGPSNRTFWDEVFSFADTSDVERFVIDIRENTGGNGFLNRYLIQQILRRPALDRSDVLHVIIGRRTFSAGQQLANQLEWWTNATFVGEPTGQRPSQYGDHEPLVLPTSGITVNISSAFHQAPNPFDERHFLAPDVYTPLRSVDYSEGRDPAMAAVVASRPTVTLADRIDELVADGDIVGAERMLREVSSATENRFSNFESDVNALGYRLLSDDRLDHAITVFEINTRVYLHSANTYDSLGEALALAGRSEEAIAAYRRALEIDPAYRSSIEALQRLERGRN